MGGCPAAACASGFDVRLLPGGGVAGGAVVEGGGEEGGDDRPPVGSGLSEGAAMPGDGGWVGMEASRLTGVGASLVVTVVGTVESGRSTRAERRRMASRLLWRLEAEAEGRRRSSSASVRGS